MRYQMHSKEQLLNFYVSKLCSNSAEIDGRTNPWIRQLTGTGSTDS